MEREQFQAERFDLGKNPVERSLIGKLSGQDGVTALHDAAQGRKGIQEDPLQDAPNADLVDRLG